MVGSEATVTMTRMDEAADWSVEDPQWVDTIS